MLGLQLRYVSVDRDGARARMDTFSHAVTSSLFSRNRQHELPDTFYMDSDRLRALRLEIEDLVHLEMCFTLFTQVRRGLGNDDAVSKSTQDHLRSSLVAIMGECISHGSPAWMYNSESLSLEIYRQAHTTTGRSPVFNHSILQNANERLRLLFHHTFTSHASTLEAVLLPQILTSVHKHYNSSSMELYNSLVATPPPTSTTSLLSLTQTIDTFSPSNSTPQERLNDLSNRISHIVLLHWRIWAPITYVQDDSTSTTHRPLPSHPSAHTQHVAAPSGHTAPPPPPKSLCSPSAPEHEMQVVNVMKTGEPPDPGSGYESGVSEEARLP